LQYLISAPTQGYGKYVAESVLQVRRDGGSSLRGVIIHKGVGSYNSKKAAPPAALLSKTLLMCSGEITKLAKLREFIRRMQWLTIFRKYSKNI
jgi:hypothetical protein